MDHTRSRTNVPIDGIESLSVLSFMRRVEHVISNPGFCGRLSEVRAWTRRVKRSFGVFIKSAAINPAVVGTTAVITSGTETKKGVHNRLTVT